MTREEFVRRRRALLKREDELEDQLSICRSERFEFELEYEREALEQSAYRYGQAVRMEDGSLLYVAGAYSDWLGNVWLVLNKPKMDGSMSKQRCTHHSGIKIK